jgi:hypothetical protein
LRRSVSVVEAAAATVTPGPTGWILSKKLSMSAEARSSGGQKSSPLRLSAYSGVSQTGEAPRLKTGAADWPGAAGAGRAAEIAQSGVS